MRHISREELTHERLGDRFAEQLSVYDTERRLEVLVDEFLGPEKLAGREVLEVGSGLGFFSERLQAAGARVTATDIGAGLLERVRVRVGCECRVVDALRLVEEFGAGRFDVVLSSECIEHTPDPDAALRQMARVLRPGGWLSVSTPNVVWWPVVRAASALRLRAFDGLENFNTFGRMRRVLRGEGVRVVREKGLHLFPFQLGMHGLSRWLDGRSQFLRAGMINLCVLAEKD